MIKENIFVLVGRADYEDSYRAIHISAFDISHKHILKIKNLIDKNHEIKEILRKYSDKEIFTGEMSFMLEYDPYVIEVGKMNELRPQDYIHMYNQALSMEIEFAKDEADKLNLSEIEAEQFINQKIKMFKNTNPY